MAITPLRGQRAYNEQESVHPAQCEGKKRPVRQWNPGPWWRPPGLAIPGVDHLISVWPFGLGAGPPLGIDLIRGYVEHHLLPEQGQERDAGTVLGEPAGGGRADSAARAGDEGGGAGQC
jgi:hypothetical protein